MRIVNAVVVVVVGSLGALATPALAAELLVTSFGSSRVGRYTQQGAFIAPLDPAGGLSRPLCTRLGPDGNTLYVVSEENHAIKRYNAATGAFIDTFIAGGSAGLNMPTGLTWDDEGHLYVSNFGSNNIVKYNGSTGAPMGTFVSSGSGGLNGPDNGTTFGPDGNLYVPSYNTNQILKYSGDDGSFLGAFVSSIARPRVIEFRNGSMYVTSETTNTVKRYDAMSGAFLSNFVTPSSGGLSMPIGMAFGDDGFLYVGSGSTSRVLRYNESTGAFVDIFIQGGLGGISAPVFITVVPAPGTGMIALSGLAIALRRRRSN